MDNTSICLSCLKSLSKYIHDRIRFDTRRGAFSPYVKKVTAPPTAGPMALVNQLVQAWNSRILEVKSIVVQGLLFSSTSDAVNEKRRMSKWTS